MRNNILFAGISFVIILLGMLFAFSDSDFLNEAFSHIAEPERVAYSLSFFFTVFVMLQFWNMFNAKAFQTGKSAFHNMNQSSGFIIVAIIILIGQVLIVEFGGDVFRTVPLTLRDWLVIIGGTSLVLWTGELLRLIKRK